MTERLVVWLVAAAVAVAAWVYADRACWSSACHAQRAAATALAGEKAAAQARATWLALERVRLMDELDAKLKKQREENDANLADLEDRARRAAGARAVAVAADSARLWRDATLAANGVRAPAPAAGGEERPAVPGPAADEVVVAEADLNLFYARASAAYRAVNLARLSCIKAYEEN